MNMSPSRVQCSSLVTGPQTLTPAKSTKAVSDTWANINAKRIKALDIPKNINKSGKHGSAVNILGHGT
jgi:hypothetical protein